jgi:hypothetical protein
VTSVTRDQGGPAPEALVAAYSNAAGISLSSAYPHHCAIVGDTRVTLGAIPSTLAAPVPLPECGPDGVRRVSAHCRRAAADRRSFSFSIADTS